MYEDEAESICDNIESSGLVVGLKYQSELKTGA